jgi:D-3-phosphoglycerate dehydrogenase
MKVHTTRRGLAATPKARATSVRATGSLAARRNASEAVQAKERRSLPFPLNKRTVAVKPLSAVQDMSSSALGNAGEVNQRPTVLVSEKLGAAGIELLEKFANVECCYDLSVDELHQKISLCDALIVRSGTQVTKEVFAASKGRLRVVGRAGVGIDNVDIHAATQNGCVVVNAPTANTVAAAEHGIALLCSFARNVPQANASMLDGKWERSKMVGVSLVDKTLAIMGFGKVGSEVARRAQGLGMKVIAYDPYAPLEKAKALGVELVDLDEAVARGDFFSLHMPLTPNTDKMFNAEMFKKMKKSAVIINVARGGVIDDQALADALDNEEIAGAALDVFTSEPPKKETNPLIGRENVILTPHLGASTVEAQEGVAVEVAEAVLTALRGEPATSAINAPMVSSEVMRELMPYADLAHMLGKVAVQLVKSNEQNINVTYRTTSPDELDTRILRANLIKGLVEHTTNNPVNLVNADLIAQDRNLKITEIKEVATGSTTNPDALINKITISFGAATETMFPSALNKDNMICVGGKVKDDKPYLTTLGQFDVDVSLVGSLVLCRQNDQPGVIGQVGSMLSDGNINVNFMTVGRTGRREEAVMAIGVDERPEPALIEEMRKVPALKEVIGIDLPSEI